MVKARLLLLAAVMAVGFVGMAHRYLNPLPLMVLPAHEECGPRLDIESPSCEIVSSKSDVYELRRYYGGEMWATTVVEDAPYNEGLNRGFMRCFHFISGNNSRTEKIPMTAPVRIHPRPDVSGWGIDFFVPESLFRKKSEVPKPLDPELEIEVEEETVRAVYGPFGGFPGQATYEKHAQELLAAVRADGLEVDEATIVYAGYSSPFTIFSRKQEVWVDVIQSSKDKKVEGRAEKLTKDQEEEENNNDGKDEKEAKEETADDAPVGGEEKAGEQEDATKEKKSEREEDDTDDDDGEAGKKTKGSREKQEKEDDDEHDDDGKGESDDATNKDADEDGEKQPDDDADEHEDEDHEAAKAKAKEEGATASSAAA